MMCCYYVNKEREEEDEVEGKKRKLNVDNIFGVESHIVGYMVEEVGLIMPPKTMIVIN